MQKILIMCADLVSEDMFRYALNGYEIELISDFSLIHDIDKCRETIGQKEFDVLILSNLGIWLNDVMEYVRRLPDKRGYRAVVITGCMTMELADICLSKGVPLAKLPMGREGMIALISGEWENR